MNIPNCVTNIDVAFYNCGSLTNIALPNSLTSIPGEAFSHCTNLATITIPNSVTSIGVLAFQFCTNLTSVTIPDSVTNIEQRAFDFCTSLTNVTIGNGLTTIVGQLFEGCASLATITIGDGVASIARDAFGGCASLSAMMVDPLNPVYSSADGVIFNKDQSMLIECLPGRIGSYTIPNTVTNIAPGAFGDCGLTSITIPSSLTSIGYEAFESCTSLSNVTIPNTVTRIGDYAFGWCTSLSSITIPNSVTGIGYGAFELCSALTSVTIGNSVTSIGGGAFCICTSLTNVTIPNSVTDIGYGVFQDCTNLTNVIIGNSVTSIGGGAFTDTGLTSITIPNSVTTIGSEAFARCSGLSSVYFWGNAPDVAPRVFDGDSNLTVFYLPGTTGWGATYGGFPTAWWPVLPYYTYTTDNGAITITGYTGQGGAVVVPSTLGGLPVTRIGDAAFASCASLTSVTIARTVISIGDAAFSACTNLTSVYFEGNAPSLGGPNVFHDDTNAVAYYLRGAAGWGATYGGLPTALWFLLPYTYTANNGVITITGYTGFGGAETIPSTIDGLFVTSIGYAAFGSGTNLTNITIPNSVSSIGDYAFDHCTNLTGVYFNGNAPSLGGTNVFTFDSHATVYYLPGTRGWDSAFGGCPTALWALPYPVILTATPNFGVQTNRFGFIISWATNLPVVVEASTRLANPNWSPVATNTLASGTSYFSDTQWTNYPARFYRVRWP